MNHGNVVTWTTGLSVTVRVAKRSVPTEIFYRDTWGERHAIFSETTHFEHVHS
ncbi:uncharacterized protein METZ01_LOCUS135916, partial [marine metagenome]